jgi:DNA-binding PadR family transcriptional regulator
VPLRPSVRAKLTLRSHPVGVGGDGRALDYRLPIYHNSTVTREKSPKPLPAASLHLVLALLEGENHGYALMRRVEEISAGAVRMGPGTLYGTLNRLLADGLIMETTDEVPRDDNERRRYYQLTGEGETVARNELARLRNLVGRLSGFQPGLGSA